MTALHTTQSRFIGAENNQRMAKPALVPLSQEEQKLAREVTKRITNCLNRASIDIERCEAKSLLWQSWCEQIQKVSLSCRDSNCSRTRFWTWKWKFHPCIFHDSQFSFHDSVLFTSFAKTTSGLWLLRSVEPLGHRLKTIKYKQAQHPPMIPMIHS